MAAGKFSAGCPLPLRQPVLSAKERNSLLRNAQALILLSSSLTHSLHPGFFLTGLLYSEYMGRNYSPEKGRSGSSRSFKRITSCLSSNGTLWRRASCVTFFILSSTQYRWDSSGL